jgi:uncharacterized protein (TIGR01777 family)
MDVVVSGATGLIGTALVTRLRSGGHRVRRLVRHHPAPDDITWDPGAGRLDGAALEGVDGVVHLAGAGIGDHRWTPAYKRQIMESRTGPTALLATTLAGMARPPSVLVSASAVGYYGDRGDTVLDERSPAGTDFLAEVCTAWEAATEPAARAGIRVVHVRTGIVLAANGGALAKLLPLFRFGLGGRFARGRQWQSWISLDDEVGAIVHLLGADVRGAANLTAPFPVTNAEFATTLGKVLHRPSVLPIPSFGPKLLLGSEAAEAILFASQRVMPAVLRSSGYSFRHHTLDVALRSVLDRPAPV